MLKTLKKLDTGKIFSTFNLNYKTEDVLKSIDEYEISNPKDGLILENKKVWIKGKPEIVNLIADDIREAFDIPHNDFVLSLYLPPEKKGQNSFKEKNTVISPPSSKVLKRIVCDTISEVVKIKTFNINGVESDIKVKPWEALNISIPFMNSIIEFNFSNSFTDKLEARKGFRTGLIKKDPSKRYVFVFDFCGNKTEEMEEKEDFSNLVKDL